MKKQNLDTAKEIFFNHNCDHFFMSRDDTYGEYMKCKISKQQELIWLTEYMNRLLEKISGEKSIREITWQMTRLSNAVSRLKYYDVMVECMDRAIQLVRDVIYLVSKKFDFDNLDTFSFIRLAESALVLLSKTEKDMVINKSIYFNLFKSANIYLHKEKTVSKEFEQALRPEDFSEEVLNKRLNSIIEKCNIFLN